MCEVPVCWHIKRKNLSQAGFAIIATLLKPKFTVKTYPIATSFVIFKCVIYGPKELKNCLKLVTQLNLS